jgi:hypothetical protein
MLAGIGAEQARLQKAGELCKKAGVEAVGLGGPAHGASEAADIAWVDQGHGQALLEEGLDEAAFIAAGGLDGDAGRIQGSKTPAQRRAGLWIVVDAEALRLSGERGAEAQDVDVEVSLGDVDADEAA